MTESAFVESLDLMSSLQSDLHLDLFI